MTPTRSVAEPLPACAAAAIIACLFTMTTRADVDSTYTNSTHYDYHVSHVPDFDQRRFLLDNAGSMYCVPTSAVNWMAYFCNHGALGIGPGAGNWQSQSLYMQATTAIDTMGTYMGTDGIEGTSGGTLFGIMHWLAPLTNFPSNYIVTHQYMNYNWSPRFQDMSMQVFNGGYVMPGVGWYEEYKFEPGVMKRDGGHALSLNYGVRNGSTMTVGWRDPARDEGGVPTRLILQSNFASEHYSIEPRQRMPIMDGVQRPSRTMDKILDYGSGYLDGYVAIRPLFSLSSLPDKFTFKIAQHWGIILDGSNQSQFSTVDIDNLPLHSIALHPDQTQVAYVAGDPPTLSLVNVVTGEITPIDVGLTNPSQVVFGRRRSLYLLDGDGLYCINLDKPQPEIEGFVVPLGVPSAICYDDASDQVKVLSVSTRKVAAYPWHLKGGPLTFTLPPSVSLFGNTDMAADQTTGGVWIVSDASDTIYHAKVNAATGGVQITTIVDATVDDPTSVDVGDGDRVFVARNGHVHEYIPAPGGTWQTSPTPLFATIQVGDIFRVASSRTNFDPDMHVLAEWHNALPEEGLGDPIPDCMADINLDGSVNAADLLALINAWGPCNGECVEDLNADTTVNAADLLQLINSWGPCP